MRLLQVVITTFAMTAQAAPPAVDIAPLRFVPPEPGREVLSNGVVVYFQEDHQLPLISFHIDMKSSPAFEKKQGMFELLNAVWRAGGTKNKSPEELNEELEFISAGVETGAGSEKFTVSASCLSKDMDRVLDLFTEVLFSPRFDSSQIRIAQGKILEAIRRKNDTPAQIGRRAFRDVIYGPAHFYALDPNESDIKSLKKSELVRLHKTVVVPDGAIMTVAGDVDRAAFLKKLEDRFSRWKKTGRVLPGYDYSPRRPPAGKIFFVDKDSTQSRVAIGRLGFARLSPDRIAVQLADYIFGGGGPSRLFNEIRSRQGLAYTVGSFFTAYEGPGMIGAICQTKAETTVEATRALKLEFVRLVKSPPGESELKLAKEAAINSFVFGFDAADEIAGQKADEEFFGYPPDHIRTFTARIAAVSLEGLLEIIGKYYAEKDLKIVVVGSEKKFLEPVQSLGDTVILPLEKVE